MIQIPDVKTARFSATMSELSILNSIKLASIPDALMEASHAHLIGAAIQKIKGVDINDLTVQERIFLVSHYIAAMQDNPDFEIGDGKYTDYLYFDRQYSKDIVEVGALEGDDWSVGHLYAVAADAIERLQGEIDGLEGVAHWQVGRMAAQLIANGDALDHANPNYEKELLERMKIFANFPESAFVGCQVLLQIGCDQLSHLVEIAVDNSGIVVMPRVDLEQGERGAKELPYARFPAIASITELAQRLCGKPK